MMKKTNFDTPFHKRYFYVHSGVLVCILSSGLVGCFGLGDAKESDVQNWMNEERALAKPRVTPITVPKPYNPQNYDQQRDVDPFNNQKLLQALRRDKSQMSASLSLVAPEIARKKETLESYPLDTMNMVGILNKGTHVVALIKIDKLLHQVKVGQHMGQNFGLVTKITDTQVTLREIVQDATGEWKEHISNLELQTSTASTTK